MSARTLLLLLMLGSAMHRYAALDWRRRRDSLLGIQRKQKGSKAGWKRVKKRSFKREGRTWEWERLDIPADAGLRVGVKHRPKLCPVKSKSGDYLSVHYNGTLYSNGDLFDSSILREEPFVFQIGHQQTIEGFEKGCLNMCIGEKRKLVVPSGMAYRETKAHGSEIAGRVMPGATLVYEVELLDILSEDDAASHFVWDI